MVVGLAVNMKKPAVTAALALVALSLAVPAHADDDSDFGGGVSAVGDGNFTGSDSCLQELAVMPVFGGWTGNHQSDCSSGNTVAPAK